MKIESKFDIGQRVTLVTDVEKRERIITAFNVRAKDFINYGVVCGLEESWHSECEMEAAVKQQHHEAGFRKKEKGVD